MNILKKVLREVGLKKLPAYGATDPGIQREENQDSFLLLPERGIYVVADGMGGHNAGEVASQKAIKIIGKYFSSKCVEELKKSKNVKDRLTYAVLIAHEQILKVSETKQEYTGMGSTIAIIFIDQNVLHTCHVGDTRVYVINPSGITQITRDHSTVGELVRVGKLTKDEARYSSMKNEVTQALGVSLTRGPEYNRTYALNEGDIVLVCSDGLWDMLSDDEILSVVMKGKDMKETCSELIQQANEAGGEDNITVVMTRINGDNSK